MGEAAAASGPDFSLGIPLSEIPAEGMIAGRVGDEPVLLSRFNGELFAVGAACTHYGAALAEGLVDRDRVHCPLHHACFSLKTGAALRAPALDDLDQWRVNMIAGSAFVTERLGQAPAAVPVAAEGVGAIVIVGGGAAGLACAAELRRLGYAAAITMLSADSDAPCDRPNLSKDYLAGTAPEEWLPLRADDWYRRNAVDLRLGTEVKRVDAAERRVRSSSGEEFAFDRLLIATGSEPNRLQASGFDCDNVVTLRSVADARAIAARAEPGARIAVIGSSFIGLEAAAALRKRGAEVDVVSLEHVPFQHVFGAEIGHWLQSVHELNGVRFHFGTVAAGFDGRTLCLANGERIDTDLVLVGIGVRPRTSVAESAGIVSEGGVPVDAFLETPKPGIFAAGDVVAYPDPLSGEPVRIEHWVTAERQGQTAAANMLGLKRPYCDVPFFWTEQFGIALRYVGDARRWDRLAVDGSIDQGDFIARYYERGVHRASAAVGRDREILEDERRLAGIASDVVGRREPHADSTIQSAEMGAEVSRGSE